MELSKKQKKNAKDLLNSMCVNAKFACNSYSVTKHYRYCSPAEDNFQTELYFDSFLMQGYGGSYIILGQDKKEWNHGYGIDNEVLKNYMESREANIEFFTELMYPKFFLGNLAKKFKELFQKQNKQEIKDYHILWEYMKTVLEDVADFVEIEDDAILIWKGQFFSIKYGYMYSYNEQGRYEHIIASKYIRNHEEKDYIPIVGYSSWFDSKNVWRCHYITKNEE